MVSLAKPNVIEPVKWKLHAGIRNRTRWNEKAGLQVWALAPMHGGGFEPGVAVKWELFHALRAPSMASMLSRF